MLGARTSRPPSVQSTLNCRAMKTLSRCALSCGRDVRVPSIKMLCWFQILVLKQWFALRAQCGRDVRAPGMEPT